MTDDDRNARGGGATSKVGKVGIGIERLSHRKDREGFNVKKLVYFGVYTDVQHFGIEIEIPMATEDHNVVAVARAMLHDILQSCLETTTEWVTKPE